MARAFTHLASLAAITICTTANAQDFRQSAPKVPQPTVPVVTPPDVPFDGTDDSTPVISELKGLRFIVDPADADAASSPGLHVAQDLKPLLAREFQALANDAIGKPASLASLNKLARSAVLAYRQAGHPLVDVAIVAQDVSDGIVSIVVREFLVGSVAVEGNKHFATDLLRRYIRLEPGDQVDQPALVDDLNLLSQNPFRRVDLIYRRGEAPLTTDVVVRVIDRHPLRVYASYENNGVVATGRDRWSAGFNWGNVFGGDGQFAYQFTASSDGLFRSTNGLDSRFRAHSFTFVQPVNRSNNFIVFGTYQRTRPDLGPNFTLTGENYQLSPRFTFPVFGNAERRGQLSIGYDFKRTNNNLLFGGLDVSDEATEVHQAVIDLTLSQRWSLGLFSSSVTGFFSPGGIGSRNTDAAFQPGVDQIGTPFARAQYAYVRAIVTQTTPIGSKGFEAITRVTGQAATSNLLPTEQLAAAGPGLVRSYDPNSVLGSQGVLFTQEFWWPQFSPFGSKNPVESARIGAFFDAGMVGNARRLPGEARWVRTTSAGVVARYNLGPYLEIRGDYGLQMRRQPGRDRLGSVGFISITTGF